MDGCFAEGRTVSRLVAVSKLSFPQPKAGTQPEPRQPVYEAWPRLAFPVARTRCPTAGPNRRSLLVSAMERDGA